MKSKGRREHHSSTKENLSTVSKSLSRIQNQKFRLSYLDDTRRCVCYETDVMRMDSIA
ncbi:unnamed protein product, partial [Larinioides sclopetarius]